MRDTEFVHDDVPAGLIARRDARAAAVIGEIQVASNQSIRLRKVEALVKRRRSGAIVGARSTRNQQRVAAAGNQVVLAICAALFGRFGDCVRGGA